MIRILRGPAGAGKTTVLYGILLEKANENKDKNHILSVPEQFTLSAMRSIMEMSSQKGMLNIDVLSFNRLSHRIFESSGSESRELLDDTAKNLIIRQIASEKRDELKVFGSNMNKQGYVSSVKSVISEFMQYGYGLFDIDEMIDKAGKTQPYLALKLKDIKVIYEEFQKRLGKEYMTVEELLVRAASDAGKADFLKGADIYLDGFTGFTPVQYRLIESLYGITGRMYVTVTDDGSADSLFKLGSTTIDKLESIAGGDIELTDVNDLKIVRHKGNPAFTFLGENIFRRRDALSGAGESIRAVKASDIKEEVRSVIRDIRKLTIEEGMRYRDIAIIMGDTAGYADMLKKEAERCNVPVYLDTTRGIELNPFSRLLKAAVNCAAEDMSYESVFNFLRSGLSGLSADDIDLAENYVRAFKIRGMKKYASGFKGRYKGISEEMESSAELVRARVYDLIKPLYDIKDKASARDYTQKLYDLSLALSMENELKKRAEEFEKAGDGVRKMEFEQVYAEIMDLFDRIVSLIGDRYMDIGEYSGILDAGLSEIRVGTLPPVNDCVHAGDLMRSRFNDIRVLFIMGLSEGNIPSAPVKGGIISDMDRQLLKDNEFELAPTAVEKTDTEKFYYYMNILKPTDRLYLSYAASDPDGSVRKASYFMKETVKLFSDITIREYDGSREVAFYDESDVLIRLSEIIGDNEEAYRLYNAVKGRDEAGWILDAYFHTGADRLSEAAGRLLFGGLKLESASELEKFAACAYAHYLQYGLRLRERFDFEFEASDIGSLLHETLKRYSEEVAKRGLTFVSVTDEASDEILNRALVDSENEKIEKLFESSSRNAYMKSRIERIAKRTVDTLRFQAGKGDLQPSAFEKKFSCDGIRGYIDRVDKYDDGQDIYIDIIDYKSGNKTFDRDRIYYGLDLQLVIYMSAAMDIEIGLSGRDKSRVHPAGLFYYHIDDPLIDTEKEPADDEIADLIRSKLRLRGVVNSDPGVLKLFDRDLEAGAGSGVVPVRLKNDGQPDRYSNVASEDELNDMITHTMEKVDEFKEAIRQGHIEKEPYVLGNEQACSFCGFVSICDRGKKRKLKKIN